MAIRLRFIEDKQRYLAIGCNESPPKNGDVFINDAQQEALFRLFHIWRDYAFTEDYKRTAMPSKEDRELLVSEFDVDYFMKNNSSEGHSTIESAEAYRDRYLEDRML